MRDRDLAVARARTWGLFGQLMLRGPVPAVAASVAAIPSLSEALAGRSEETMAAAHHAVLGAGVHPYASVFLEPEAKLGGATASRARAALDSVGFRGRVANTEPDHLGVLCLGMAHACQAEAEAWEDGRQDVVRTLQSTRKDFLASVVTSWLPPLVIAVQRQGDPFFSSLVVMIAELTASHGPFPVDAPSLASRLEEEATLRVVVERLLIPAQGGWWLSASTLARWGHELNLPIGFGGRRQRLQQLVKSSGAFESTGGLARYLRAERDIWADGYAELGALGLPVAVWEQRLALIDDVASGLAQVAPD